MAKRKQIESAGGDPVANPDNAPQQGQTELPLVDSPSLSPASDVASEPMAKVPAVEAAAVNETNIDNKKEEPTIAQANPARARWPQLHLRPRHRRHAMLAASVVIAASVGVLAGATLTGGFSKPASVDVIGLEESKTAQQSIARLSKDVASLKASLEAANKTAHSQFAKLSERLARDSAEITGAITPPQTVPPTSPAAAPLPPGTSGIRSGIPASSIGHLRLDDPRNARRLCLRARSRRRLSGRAGRAFAGHRAGRADQAAGRSLGRGHAEGHHCLDARPPLFRAVLDRSTRTTFSGAFGRRSSFAREVGGEHGQTMADSCTFNRRG
jgi:hypothetical protein